MTAELAVALPAVVLVIGAVLLVVAASTSQMRCADAARAGARAAARGESGAVALEAARSTAPKGATISMHRIGSTVRVEVRDRVALLGPIGRGHISIGVGAALEAPVESGSDSGGR
ncbi:MAG: TadE family type IV pilus minor pilin [Actinomycetes bacterium]